MKKVLVVLAVAVMSVVFNQRILAQVEVSAVTITSVTSAGCQDIVTPGDLKDRGRLDGKLMKMARHGVHTINSEIGGIDWYRAGTVTGIRIDGNNGPEILDTLGKTNLTYWVTRPYVTMYESVSLYDEDWNLLFYSYNSYTYGGGITPPLVLSAYSAPFDHDVEWAYQVTTRPDGSVAETVSLGLTWDHEVLVRPYVAGAPNCKIEVYRHDGTSDTYPLGDSLPKLEEQVKDWVRVYNCQFLTDQDINLDPSWESQSVVLEVTKVRRFIVNAPGLAQVDDHLVLEAAEGVVIQSLNTCETETIPLRHARGKLATLKLKPGVYLISFKYKLVGHQPLWTDNGFKG